MRLSWLSGEAVRTAIGIPMYGPSNSSAPFFLVAKLFGFRTGTHALATTVGSRHGRHGIRPAKMVFARLERLAARIDSVISGTPTTSSSGGSTPTTSSSDDTTPTTSSSGEGDTPSGESDTGSTGSGEDSTGQDTSGSEGSGQEGSLQLTDSSWDTGDSGSAQGTSLPGIQLPTERDWSGAGRAAMRFPRHHGSSGSVQDGPMPIPPPLDPDGGGVSGQQAPTTLPQVWAQIKETMAMIKTLLDQMPHHGPPSHGGSGGHGPGVPPPTSQPIPDSGSSGSGQDTPSSSEGN